VAFESAVSSKTSIEQNSDFSVSVSENERAYSFLKYLVQENDIHVDLPGLKTFLSFSETD
jgi:hypothetical protein